MAERERPLHLDGVPRLPHRLAVAARPDQGRGEIGGVDHGERVELAAAPLHREGLLEALLRGEHEPEEVEDERAARAQLAAPQKRLLGAPPVEVGHELQGTERAVGLPVEGIELEGAAHRGLALRVGVARPERPGPEPEGHDHEGHAGQPVRGRVARLQGERALEMLERLRARPPRCSERGTDGP